MVYLRYMLITAISLLILFLLSVLIIGYILSAPVYHGPVSGHFNGNSFINRDGVQAKGFKDLIRWVTARNQGHWETSKNLYVGGIEYPRITEGERVYFINHSTFLIQTNGINILTDPIWSRRAGPFSWIGPERKRPPGIKFEDLPEIDLILLSHNHYDHLDLPTLKKLYEKFRPDIIVPLGVSRFLINHDIHTVMDMDWWDEKEFRDRLTIACVPAQHFSGRGFFDRDKTLWAGYVIKTGHGNIYFAGDTGYGQIFKEIGTRYAPMDMAILPIGAYLPVWFMSPIHTSPADAISAHLDLNATISIAGHFGTFPLADDGMLQPVEALNKAKKETNVKNFMVLEEGHFFEMK